MKAIWTGSIGFGLVNIPVKMYSAVEDSSLSLDMLDKKDHANIRFKRVNEKTGKEVPWENIVKGYLVGDKYVVLDKSDFEKASPEKSKHVEITQFVNLEEIDTNYFEQPYYLEPDKTGTRAYALLCEALLKSKKAGIGMLVMHSREHLCLIKAQEHTLVLNRIRFAEEVRDPAELKIPTTKSKPPELKMALSLVNQLTKKFDISAFRDDYSDKLMKLIQAKAKGKTIKVAPMKVVHSNTKDLMEQLKASLTPARSSSRKKAS
ncbi:non-homologous end joining protein Ku [Flavihumibacter petaseus]|uniref:Non-homologous end joining protein Ku n=1 Tax=Flavihumibacter petaseus NBRC 106054 TaxID=1220578 RepID=A0A0E9MV11_9BACT|nr:Ku protein [Flavihumibacter petaseus]GAO41587.1 putative DNA repair protein [Flavihumibacter petaseus NBRC 106054]